MSLLVDRFLTFITSREIWLNGLVFLLPCLIYISTVGFPLLEHDDNLYISENTMIQHGGWVDFLTSRYQGNWIPLTWTSFSLDWKLFGHWAGGFHLINMLLHAACSLLLFLSLKRWGMVKIVALAVSLTFALHPINVESVAWVSSRKDGLAALFALGAVY